MTFSVAGRCPQTGMFGVAVTTSSICVGARCPWARAGVGAVATQNVTDPRLGSAVLDALEEGLDAARAVERVIAGHDPRRWRQLTAVDAAGRVAHYTGAGILGTNEVAAGVNCIAAGNLLSTTEVPHAMVAAYTTGDYLHLAERLLRSLEAGVTAGGEQGPTHSASLLVVHEQPFALVDLRVDWDDQDPVAALRSLWSAYEPQMQAYLDRAIAPEQAPAYGVPGDP